MLASHYRCGNPNCSSITTQETYYLSVIASDGVGEAEFTMFDKVGKTAIGKPLLPLLKFRNARLSTIRGIARVPMVDKIAPPEVTLSFQVVKIIETYKPELSSSAFDYAPGASGASSSAYLTDSPVPSEMFTPNTPSIQQAHPCNSSGSLAMASPSPTANHHAHPAAQDVPCFPTITRNSLWRRIFQRSLLK